MKALYAMLGAPGTGKTTFLNNASMSLFNDTRLMNYVVSPDDIRLKVQGPKQKPDGSFGIGMDSEGFVWDIVNNILDRKVQKGETIIVDATHSRNSAISAYKKYSDLGYRIYIIDFREVDLETVLDRNRSRPELKFVPEDRVQTMHERIQVMDLPGWVEVINPKDFVDHFRDIKFDFSHMKALTFIGDIHGCSDELNSILAMNNIDPEVHNKDELILFIGDYFDRGPKIAETFKILQQLQKTKDVMFLIGNHEEPLQYMKQMYMIAWDAWTHYFKEITDPDSKDKCSLTFQNHFRKYVGVSWKNTDELIEDLRINGGDCFSDFKKYLYSWKLNSEDSKLIKKTSRFAMKQLIVSDITYQEVSVFYRKLAQFFYADYGTATILATHGGLPTLPTRLTPTSDFIRGVGGYDDTQEVDNTFTKMHPGSISIHGHRNTTNIPVQSAACAFNINGDVDLGVRSIKINRDLSIEINEVPPTQATKEFNRARQIRAAKKFGAKKLTHEEENRGFLKLFQDHKHVDVKKLPDDIVAVNFTRKAFEKGIWDGITLKARGLFLDNSIQLKVSDATEDAGLQEELADSVDVIARGYMKFFNLGERHGVQSRDLRELVYPIRGYEKANGYLGLLSVDARSEPKWFMSSKSTNVGDFAQQFNAMISPSLTKELLTFMQEKNITLAFEVIEPDWDPHIEEYSKPELVILDAIKNQMEFERLDYKELSGICDLFNADKDSVSIRVKRILGDFETFNDLTIFINRLNSVDLLSPNGIEGVVFEDSSASAIMFKLKTKWYSFWKYQRSLQDRVLRQLRSKHGMTKSDIIRTRERLHTVEEIKVFEALVKISKENDGVAYDVPRLRKKIIEKITKG